MQERQATEQREREKEQQEATKKAAIERKKKALFAALAAMDVHLDSSEKIDNGFELLTAIVKK